MGTIFTIDARDNVMLEVIASYFNLNHEQMHFEINKTFQKMVEILQTKGIEYQDLKSCLTPSLNRLEIIFVFDSNEIDSSFYGYPVFEKIIPLFDKRSSHSVLTGDFIDSNKNQDFLYERFAESIILVKDFTYIHSSLLFFVYINNMTINMFHNMNEGLKSFKPYVGFIDVTNSCYMKTYASMTIINDFIKNKSKIIMGHEDDVEESKNFNMSGYPFEENGYTCISLPGMYYDLFLSYKIERKIYKGFEKDTLFSLNTVSRSIFDIDDFEILIEKSKLKYLLERKRSKFKKGCMLDINVKELEELIRSKIKDNYIYNMEYDEEHHTTKFNIQIEIIAGDTGEILKFLVSLEYIPDQKILRVITMY